MADEFEAIKRQAEYGIIAEHLKGHIVRALSDCPRWKGLNLAKKVEFLTAVAAAILRDELVAAGYSFEETFNILKEVAKRSVPCYEDCIKEYNRSRELDRRSKV